MIICNISNITQYCILWTKTKKQRRKSQKKNKVQYMNVGLAIVSKTQPFFFSLVFSSIWGENIWWAKRENT